MRPFWTNATLAHSNPVLTTTSGVMSKAIHTPIAPTRDIHVLRDRAITLRKHIVEMLAEAGSGHPGGSLSAVEIVTALYFAGFLRYDPENPEWADRDRFILSKGHGVPVQYAALAEAGFLPVAEL